MTSLVTVVVPTRDRADMLLQTVRTVLAQSVPLELVVVDEGSSDDTLVRLRALDDPRVRVVHHDVPRGLPRARNAGIEVAEGEVVAFVDDDDLWSPDKLALQLAALDEHGASWAVGGSVTFSAGPRLERVDEVGHPAEIASRLPYANAVPGGGSNAIVLRSALDRVGGFDPQIPQVADWDLWIRLAELGPPAVVPRPLLAYRRHGGNMSRRSDEMIAQARVIDERYRYLRGGRSLDWPDLYRWLTRSALVSGDWRGARRLALSTVRAGHPRAKKRYARTMVPIAPRAPVSQRDDVRGLARLHPPPVVPWPDGTESWLVRALEDRGSA